MSDPVLDILFHRRDCKKTETSPCNCGCDRAINHYRKVLEERDGLLRMERQYWTIINNPSQAQCADCMSRPVLDHYRKVLADRDRLREALKICLKRAVEVVAEARNALEDKTDA